jgi:HAD superfamily hydrolase (TIGR01549 family)
VTGRCGIVSGVTRRFDAVLFDVGGPLDTEVQAERYIDERIKAALREAGVPVTDEEYAKANRLAVESFAPSAYQAIIWRLVKGDLALAARFRALQFPGRQFELRPGIDRIINRVSASGLRLGLAANQPASVIDELDRLGIGRYFSHRQVSGHHGFRKPDMRLFLAACGDLAVEPARCIMVGDRIDNDIAPARLLGMTTVLFRTGRHIGQQPRSVEEVPDCEVWTTDELERVLIELIG